MQLARTLFLTAPNFMLVRGRTAAAYMVLFTMEENVLRYPCSSPGSLQPTCMLSGSAALTEPLSLCRLCVGQGGPDLRLTWVQTSQCPPRPSPSLPSFS